jgi:hypothetical protein
MITVLREYINTITDMDTYFEKDKTDKFYLSFIKYMKNGFYIPILYYGLLWLTQNLFLSTIIILKLYPANHYYWFTDAYSYSNIPKQLTFMKQFVRMTDTGHLVSFLYLVDKTYLPLAHNVHFFITVGYWTGKAIGSLDQDIVLEKPDSGIIRWYETAWSSLNHGLPYLLFLREMIISNKCYSFDYHTLWLSYQWNYIWLVFIYIPWRLYTGDIIYSILDIKSGYEKPLKFFIFLHLVTLFANITGYVFSFGLFYVSFQRDFQKIDHFDGF